VTGGIAAGARQELRLWRWQFEVSQVTVGPSAAAQASPNRSNPTSRESGGDIDQGWNGCG